MKKKVLSDEKPRDTSLFHDLQDHDAGTKAGTHNPPDTGQENNDMDTVIVQDETTEVVMIKMETTDTRENRDTPHKNTEEMVNTMDVVDEKKRTTLVLSGGSILGISFLGAIQCLVDRDMMKDIHTYIGCSVGALISYLLILGYSPIEIMVMICQKGFLENMVNLDVTRLFRGEKAVCSFHGLQGFLEKCTIDKLGRFVTFSQLNDMTGKTLVCSTFNMSKSCVEYMSKDTHADMPVLVAIRMTCSLPLLFDPMPYMGSQYVDGALGDDFPISCVTSCHDGRVIGICMDTRRVCTGMTPSENNSPWSSQSENLFFYIYSIFEHFILLTRRHHIQSLEKKYRGDLEIFSIPTPSTFTAFRLLLTTTDKFDLFSHGYEYIRHQLTSEKKKPSTNC